MLEQKMIHLRFHTLRDQHHQRGEMPPKSMDGYRSFLCDAKDYIEQHVVPVPCSLLAKDADKSIASTHWSHYPLQAKGSSAMKMLQQPEKPVPGLIVRHLRHLKPGQFHSHSA